MLHGENLLKYILICLLSLILGFAAGAVVWAVLQVMDLGIEAVWTRLPEKIGCGHSIVLGPRVDYIGIDGMVVALQLPGTGDRDIVPA